MLYKQLQISFDEPGEVREVQTREVKRGDLYILGDHRILCGGGLHGKDLSKADVSVNIYLHELARAYNATVEASCGIGGSMLHMNEANTNPRFSPVFRYEGDIVGRTDSFELATQVARRYIKRIGGFERFAEWGLI